MNHMSLNGTGWKMTDCSSKETYAAAAPCSVLSVLLEAGVIKDPYYRENEKNTLSYLERDFIFSRNFNVDGELMQEDCIELVFCGLDTITEIFLNGEKLAITKNMHRTYRFEVKDRLHMGANELFIHFHSPLQYIRDYQPQLHKEITICPTGALPGGQYLRKTQSSFGWDWGPQLPDMGIFREIRIEAFSYAHIREVSFYQEHIDGEVTLFVDPLIEFSDPIPVEIEVRVTGEEPVTVMTRMTDAARQQTEKGENEVGIPIHDPQLWWPNGMGAQPLYDVKVSLKKADKVYDEKSFRIGLRTITVSREADEYGEEFCFVVNGQKMFAKGANYIPEDAIYPYIREDKIRTLIESACLAHFNCQRVWGGGYYPSDLFYDLCDAYGIVVWQDLMYACNAYDLTTGFENSILAETRDNVIRLRHHACLGLWCGNNEMESGWHHWGEFQKQSPQLRADYIKMFEYLLPKAVRENDEQTFYWPSSPSSGGCFDEPDREDRGDAHYWGVWHEQKPFQAFREHYFRFLSEFGFQSFPGIKTVRSFTEPEDLNIFSPVMESHQKNPAGNGKILYYLSENFRYPKDFEQLLYVSQILQGMAIKSGVEHFRRHRGRCMGTLYWQLNDNWPVASWSSIDYYGRWKALHYLACRFYAPLAPSIVLKDTAAFVYIVNDTREDMLIRVKVSMLTMEGKELTSYREEAKCAAGSVWKSRGRELGHFLNGHSLRDVYVVAEFDCGEGKVLYEDAVFVPYKHLRLAPIAPLVDVTEAEDGYMIRLQAEGYIPFVYLDLQLADVIFSDNTFSLHKDKEKIVYVQKDGIHCPEGVEIRDAQGLLDQLVVYTLQGSYDGGVKAPETEEEHTGKTTETKEEHTGKTAETKDKHTGKTAEIKDKKSIK